MITEDRQTQRNLTAWYNLRQHLEHCDDPIDVVTQFFESLPKVKIYTDPYDQDTWPTPWELITENEFCDFNRILGICYTLQLTDRFKDYHPTIKVAFDNVNKTVYYLLFLDDKVYGYDDDWISTNKLPKSLKMQKIYTMQQLH
jgi:hypothetical protein